MLITVGRSTVLPTDFDITRIAITNPVIADAVVVAPREVLIDGKGAGTVSLIVWGAGRREQYDVVVDQGTARIEQQLHLLFPGEDIQVTANEDAVILHGKVKQQHREPADRRESRRPRRRRRVSSTCWSCRVATRASR